MIDKLSHVLSGEFLLKKRPNGGGVVLARSLFVTCWFYLLALCVKSVTDEGLTLSIPLSELLRDFNATIPWGGVIFAGVYTVFYTRYSSQWAYLASFYNKIMEVKVVLSQNTQVNNQSLINWQAAFVSDAYTLHLDTKPIFSGVIENWLTDETMRRAIASNFDVRELDDFNVRHGCRLCVCLGNEKNSPQSFAPSGDASGKAKIVLTAPA